MSFSQLLELRKGKLAAKVGIDANLEEHEVFKQVEQEMQQEEMGEKVENNKSSIAKMYNSPKPLVPSKGAIRTSAGYMLVHQDRVDEDRVQEKRTKKRKLSERLEEPIEVKTSGRCRKANVNSWRNQFLTLKKKVSRMQIEAGAEPNFLIIMMNTVQDPNASIPAILLNQLANTSHMVRGQSRRNLFLRVCSWTSPISCWPTTKNLLSTRRVLKNKTSRPKRRQQRQTKKVQKTSLLKEFQHRLKTKHRPSKLRRHCSHKMRREPLVSSLCDVDLNLSRDGQ